MIAMNQPLVSIVSMVFNHAAFLRDCLDGLVMQETSFPYEVIVHDDASTDGSDEIIEEYASKYPGLIQPILQQENQYSKKVHIGNTFIYPIVRGKYIAICEGDDYWTDPHKLQRQVDFLESHPEFVMACSRARMYSVKRGKEIGEFYCREDDGPLELKDIVNRSGLFIPTCSIVYRRSLRSSMPEFISRAIVGDYPLQIFAALSGGVYYFNDAMVVYRVDNPDSWMGRQRWKDASEASLRRVSSMLNLFSGFAEAFPEHRKLFKDKIAQHLRDQMPCPRDDYEGYLKYTETFRNYLKEESLLWKIDYKLRGTRLPILKHYYFHSKFVVRKYRRKILWY